MWLGEVVSSFEEIPSVEELNTWQLVGSDLLIP